MNNTEDVFVKIIHPEIVPFAIYANPPEKVQEDIEIKDKAVSLVQLEMKAFKEKWSLSNGLSGSFIFQ